DLFRTEQFPKGGLIVQIRARWIAEAIALATIARCESLGHFHLRWIGEAPIFAHASVQPLRAALGGFNSEGLQAVRLEILARFFLCFRALAHAFAGGDHQEPDVIALPGLRCQDVVAQAEKIAGPLSLETEGVDRLLFPG